MDEARLARAHELSLFAQAEVDLGQAEAVGVRRQRAEPSRDLAARLASAGLADQEAHAGMRATADASAQLVQLRDPELLGVLDQHHGRVGDIDPHLDHGRRDEHVGPPRRERRHRLLLLARAHPAVQQRQLVTL